MRGCWPMQMDFLGHQDPKGLRDHQDLKDLRGRQAPLVHKDLRDRWAHQDHKDLRDHRAARFGTRSWLS